MNTSRFASVALAALLNFAPFIARTFPAIPSMINSPAGILFKWVLGAIAVTGSMHTVSAATATLASAKTKTGTVGTPLSYQIRINDGQNRQPGAWTIGGVNYPNTGKTTNTMPPGLSMALNTGIISGTPTLPGTFPVTMTAYEKASRSGAKLTFTVTFTITGTAIPPSLTTSPVGGSVTEGGSFTFTVAATGDAPLTYQWSHGLSAIAGATASTLTLSPVALSDAGSYTVTVRNGAGSAVSTAVNLTVLPALTAPAISSQPADTRLHAGETLSLTVTATGSQPLSYSWKRNGAAIPGAANSATLSIPSITADQADNYSVEVAGPGGSVTSATARITVIPVALRPPTVDAAGLHLVTDTIVGRRYVLESSPSLDAASWTVAQEFSATQAATEMIQTVLPATAQFWRYRALP